jgi:hypothetical protein
MQAGNGYLLNGFSPAIMKLLADSFCRHGIDMTTIAQRLRLLAPELPQTEAQARSLVELCVSVDNLSERVATDALRALAEARKLVPPAAWSRSVNAAVASKAAIVRPAAGATAALSLAFRADNCSFGRFQGRTGTGGRYRPPEASEQPDYHLQDDGVVAVAVDQDPLVGTARQGNAKLVADADEHVDDVELLVALRFPQLVRRNAAFSSC